MVLDPIMDHFREELARLLAERDAALQEVERLKAELAVVDTAAQAIYLADVALEAEVASLRAALAASSGVGVREVRMPPPDDDGPTPTPPDGDLPSHTASLAATPQHTITIGVEDGYPVMLMRCPFDMDDPERPCWSMDEVGHRDEFSTSCNWTDWWENTDDWPIEDFTIIRGVEVADWTDYPRFVALAVTIDDAGAHEPTSAQVGQSGAALQETGGPEPEQVREQIAEIVGEATALAVSTSPDYWCGWRHECDGDVYLLTDRILALFAARETGGPDDG